MHQVDLLGKGIILKRSNNFYFYYKNNKYLFNFKKVKYIKYFICICIFSKEVFNVSEKWCLRFTVASVIHGLGVAVWSGLFLVDRIGITLNFSKIMAGGGAGTWFTIGYLLYMLTGFIGMAVQGAIYYFLPKLLNRSIYSDKLALAHFVLMNVAVVGATWLLGYAGFIGGSLAIAKQSELIHPSIVGFVEPIGYFVAIGSLSALIAIINFGLTLTKSPLKK